MVFEARMKWIGIVKLTVQGAPGSGGGWWGSTSPREVPDNSLPGGGGLMPGVLWELEVSVGMAWAPVKGWHQLR